MAPRGLVQTCWREVASLRVPWALGRLWRRRDQWQMAEVLLRGFQGPGLRKVAVLAFCGLEPSLGAPSCPEGVTAPRLSFWAPQSGSGRGGAQPQTGGRSWFEHFRQAHLTAGHTTVRRKAHRPEPSPNF